MPFKSHNHYTPTPTKALITFNKENHRNRNFYLRTAAILFSMVENQGFTITTASDDCFSVLLLACTIFAFSKDFCG